MMHTTDDQTFWLIVACSAGLTVVMAAVVFWRLYAMDQEKNLGLSALTRRRIRKTGERVPCVVLDSSNSRFIVEATPATGSPFRAELGRPMFTRSDHEADREKAFDREVKQGARLFVYCIVGDPKAVVFDLEEIYKRGKASEEAKRREMAEVDGVRAAEAEARRQKLLRGEDA